MTHRLCRGLFSSGVKQSVDTSLGVQQWGLMLGYLVLFQRYNCQLRPAVVYLWERINVLTRVQFYCIEKRMKLGNRLFRIKS